MPSNSPQKFPIDTASGRPLNAHPIMIDRNEEITTDNLEKPLILNEFLSSVFTKENTNSISHPEQVFTGDTKERLLDVDVSQSIVEKNLNKARGVDGIHPSLPRELSKQLSGPPSILFRNDTIVQKRE